MIETPPPRVTQFDHTPGQRHAVHNESLTPNRYTLICSDGTEVSVVLGINQKLEIVAGTLPYTLNIEDADVDDGL